MNQEAAGRAPESPAGPSLPPAAPAPPYRRLGGLAPWIWWVLLVLAATYATSAILTLAAHGLGEYTAPARLDRFGGADVALSIIGLLQSVLSIATAVIFIIWFYRAYENLRAVSGAGPKRSSGWTIGAWFVPILDLVLPKLMLDDVWRSSEPDPARHPSEARVPAFHHLWWWIWVAAFLLSMAVGVESAISSYESALSGPVGTTVSGAVAVGASALYAVAAVLGALVVRRTTERQDERARRLGALPRPGPAASPSTVTR